MAGTATPLRHEIARCLLDLRRAGALELVETRPGSGVHRFAFRSGGWPITVDLDATVVELRAYHGNDLIASGGLPPALLDEMVGPTRRQDGAGTDAKAAKAATDALREVVRRWKDGNARLFVESPRTARHPDGWNDA